MKVLNDLKMLKQILKFCSYGIFSSLSLSVCLFPFHVHKINTYVHVISEAGQCTSLKFSNKDIHLKFGS